MQLRIINVSQQQSSLRKTILAFKVYYKIATVKLRYQTATKPSMYTHKIDIIEHSYKMPHNPQRVFT